MPIDFLQLEDVLQIQEDQVRRYGGMVGVRDLGLLQSAIAQPAIAQPASMFGGQYLHQDIHHMAAAHLFHLCENHPFHDGNKRTAAVACITFLDLNGYELNAPEDEFEKMVWEVSQGKVDKDQIRTFLQKYSRKA